MNCPNCGATNIEGSTFCIKCGANIKEINQNNINQINQTINQPSYNQVEQNVKMTEPIFTEVNNPANDINNQINTTNINISNNNDTNTVAFNYFIYILAILLKPFTCFKEEEDKLNDNKTSIVLTVIIALFMTVIKLFKTIYSTVRVTNYSIWGDDTYSWNFENIKNINFIEVIIKNFLIYLVIIAIIAFIFYIGSMVVKKETNFFKILSVSATSLIPMVVCSMLLATITGMIWSDLSIIFTVIGGIYSFILLYELMNRELNLEGDIKIYFNIICFGILILGIYFAFVKLVMNSITGGLSNLLG